MWVKEIQKAYNEWCRTNKSVIEFRREANRLKEEIKNLMAEELSMRGKADNVEWNEREKLIKVMTKYNLGSCGGYVLNGEQFVVGNLEYKENGEGPGWLDGKVVEIEGNKYRLNFVKEKEK